MRAARGLVVFGMAVGLGLMGGMGVDDAAAQSSCEASYPETCLAPSLGNRRSRLWGCGLCPDRHPR